MIFYLFICLLPDLPPFCISLLCSPSPLNCTAAHCTVAAVWLPLFHKIFPSCLSLPADCHLILCCHSFRCPSVPYLYTIMNLSHSTCYMLLWYGHSCPPSPPRNPRSRIFIAFNFFFGLPSNYCELSGSESCRSQHTPVLTHNSCLLHSRIDCSTNITIVVTINIQGDSGGICTTLGYDSMSDSKQKTHTNMGPILNGYGVMGIF